MIREEIERHLQLQPPRRLDTYLWVSDLGMHPHKALRRILFQENPKFGVDTLIKMENGVALEAATIDALRWGFPGTITQFPLYNDIWSGYADAVLLHGTNQATIVEHKAQGDKWWNYKNRGVAKSTHVCQLWMYGQLYEEMFGRLPKMVLYYRAWGNWAELEIDTKESTADCIILNGQLDGNVSRQQFEISPSRLRAELEALYGKFVSPGGVYHVDELPMLPEDPDTWNYAEDAQYRLRKEYPLV